jgi:hypothetical protein
MGCEFAIIVHASGQLDDARTVACVAGARMASRHANELTSNAVAQAAPSPRE